VYLSRLWLRIGTQVMSFLIDLFHYLAEPRLDRFMQQTQDLGRQLV
jgi:hypothetical protein